jgi:serine phosphatase RsbU (regulator of sigma subunit)
LRTQIRKRLLLVTALLLILSANQFCGITQPFSATSFDGYPVELIDDWKYKSGDNPNWAAIDFDDSDWENVNSLNYPNNSLNWKGVGWFRKTFKIDSTLFGKTIGIRVLQCGASQIYLNGTLIHSIGKVGNSIENEDVMVDIDYPRPIELSANERQVIAVRYSNFSKPNVKLLGWQDGFYIHLGSLEKFIESRVKNEGMIFKYMLIFGGLPFVFALLHLFLYFFNRREIANLYYGILTFSIGIINFIDSYKNFIIDPKSFEPIFILSGFFAVIGIVFLLLFAYDSFQFQIPKHFLFFIVVGGILNILLFLDLTFTLGKIIQLYALIAILEICRVIFISFYFKKIKPGFLVIGFSIFIVTWLYELIISFGLIPQLFEFPIFYAGVLVLVISMSIHLSQNFAHINNELEKEIETVKELSRQKIESERIEKERELEQKLLEADNLRKTKELEEARSLQLSMLPKKLPDLPNIKIAAQMLTATEVGGDYYDFYKSGDSFTFAIGDATGHGTKAGTLVAAIKSLFNALVNDKEPLNLIIEFNSAIKKMNLPNLFMALLIGRVKNRKIVFSNSGMPPILFFNKENNHVYEITQKSMPIGGRANFPYTQDEFIAESGDSILFSSDGLIELFNSADEMLGLEGAKEIFLKSISDTPEQTIKNILTEVKLWNNNSPLRDDLTLIIMTFD